MSGHSKWSTIKRRKGVQDAKRGQLFTRLAREITIAAREGGGDVNSNFSLRIAVDRARSESMPKDNIERAIKRGTGEDKGSTQIDQVTYEAYAPHGIALLIECLTENRNRTIAELRHILTHGGGSIGEVGSVSWQFNRIAYFAIPAEGVDYDKVFEYAVEGGADDIVQDEDTIEIFAPVEVFKKISDMLAEAKIKVAEAGIRMVPKQDITLDTNQTLKVMRVIEELEDLADVQNVYSNLRIGEDALTALETV